MRAAPRPEPIRDAEEIFLVNRIQQRDHRSLDDLVLQRGDRKRALSTVRLGYVYAPTRQCPIRSPMDPTMQVLELAPEVCLVVLPRHTIYPRRGVSFEFEERLSEKINADVMEERGEPLLLSFPCDFPYAIQRLCHVSPVLRPARALLARIPLGLRPWLHRLRRGWHLRGLLRNGLLRFVRRLHSLYEANAGQEVFRGFVIFQPP